ncbi:hypothetical protein D0864_04295 [Hortaea werneckii]|uniref:histidine kinase n=1 Tax=Hortaea werneckii TaxID=91943 RepID=A0A3M7GBY5_HORWE|nr:hypothetical protein D0864_04295 [Hortaea werneckii]
MSREKEVYRYLHAWTDLTRPPSIHRSAFTHVDEDLEPSNDTALTAFAQLCALRMNVRRVHFSLVGRDAEYVLTEATRTQSLQYDAVEDPADTCWLGCCCFPRADGVNDLVMDTWRKARQYRDATVGDRHYYTEGRSEHWCIVSDASQDSEYNSRPFVQRSPGLRFYCSIPLRGRNGIVLGALSIMDDKPRYGVSAAEMLFLEDCADTAFEHLETAVLRSQQQRSEHFVQALGLFNDQKSTLRDWWLGTDNERLKRSGRYHSDEAQGTENQQARLNNEFGKQDHAGFSVANERRLRREDSTETEDGDGPTPSSQTSEANANANDARVMQGVAGHDFDQRPAKPSKQQSSSADGGPVQRKPLKEHLAQRNDPNSGSRGTRSARGNAFDLTSALEATYARASNLIREAMHVEGAVFVDAKAASAAFRNRRSSKSRSRSSTTNSGSSHGDSATNSLSEADTSADDRAKRRCTVNGFSTRSRSTLTGSPSSEYRFALAESDLRELVKRYPSGKIFNISDSGDTYSSSGTESAAGSGYGSDGQRYSRSDLKGRRESRDSARLSKQMPGARTIAFYPVWDDSAEFFTSAALVWSTTPQRFFTSQEEIMYLSAFGHSLTAELSRLNALASENAKGSFISSISHELRSPLHGVLAGAEMLQESDLTQFQQEMVLTITMAGRTLLDTVNHVLDYSKISNRPRLAKRHRGKQSEDGEMGNGESIDLAKLTEEVVESIVSAHRFELLSKTSLSEFGHPGAKSLKSHEKSPSAKDVAVVLDIERRESWWTDLSPGSWTRLVTNIVGNALKYTKSGVVTVSLGVQNGDDDSGIVRFSVQDTGIGMSQQFLATDLFTPYKQADFNLAGTGLGLSIVKEICKQVHAHLDVQSEPGRGTRVSLDVDIAFMKPKPTSVDTEDQRLLDEVKTLGSLHMHSVELAPESGRERSVGVQTTISSALSIAASWLRISTSSGTLRQLKPRTRICVIAECDLLHLARTDPTDLSRALSHMATHNIQVLILGHSFLSVSPKMQFDGFPMKPAFVHQPIGPRKLLRAITVGEDSCTPASPGVKNLYNTSPAITTPLVVSAEGATESEGDSFPWHSGRAAPQKTNDTESGGIDSGSARSKLDVETKEAASTSRQREGSRPIGEVVLLVEDNSINMQLLKALMKKLKLPIDTAEDGREAFDQWRVEPSKYLMILTDISMPVMDGNEMTAAIRAEERKRKLPRVTIVAVTGVTNAAAKKTSFDSGVDQLLTKPVKMRDLSALVAKVRGDS